ncbi:MAG: hypothetical protein PF481_02775 [Bacteroidales bacterium]|jgi:uncharacterized repeat protein (TIGR01451 family)|nr:hypothetical protein [Bacteroidales bacterium]
MKYTFFNKKIFSLVLLCYSTFSFAQMDLRYSIKGQYDVTMIGSMVLQPVWLNYENSTADYLDVVRSVTSEEQMASGKMLSLNNELGGARGIDQTENSLQMLAPAASLSSDGSKVKTALAYADCDEDASTFQSSAAYLDFGSNMACTYVKKAYLYWVGAQGSSVTYASYPDIPTMRSHTGGETGVVNEQKNTVLFKAPGDAAYSSVSGTIINDETDTYSCVADVTHLVENKMGGLYWVANVQSATNETSASSGWALIVVFEPPNCPPRTIKIWDGLVEEGTNVTFNFEPGEVPAAGNSISYLGFGGIDTEDLAFNLDADISKAQASQIQFNSDAAPAVTIQPFTDGDQEGYVLYDNDGDLLTNNARDGLVSSQITAWDKESNVNGNQITRIPDIKYTCGFDAHHMKLPSGAIGPGASSAVMTLPDEQYGSSFAFFAYMAIETMQPRLIMNKTVSHDYIGLDEIVTYNIKVLNKGGADSRENSNTYIIDELDLSVDFVPGSIHYYDKNGTEISDSPGGRSPIVSGQGTDNESLQFFVPVIEKANETTFQPADSVTITFSARVKGMNRMDIWNSGCRRTIQNMSTIYYDTEEGKILQSESNTENGCGGGDTYASTYVNDIQLDEYITKSHEFVVDIKEKLMADPHVTIVDMVRSVLVDSTADNEYNAITEEEAQQFVITDTDGFPIEENMEFSSDVFEQTYMATADVSTNEYDCYETFTLTFLVVHIPHMLSEGIHLECAETETGKINLSFTEGGSGFGATVIRASDGENVFRSQTPPGKVEDMYTIGYLPADTYYVFMDVNGVVYQTDTVVLTDPEPLVADISGSAELCVGEEAIYTVTSSTSGTFEYAWKISYDNGTTWLDLSEHADSLSMTISDTAVLRAYVCAGQCSAYDDDTVYTKPTVDIPEITLPDAVCEGNGLDLPMVSLATDETRIFSENWKLNDEIYAPGGDAVTGNPVSNIDNGKWLLYEVETDCGIVLDTLGKITVNSIPEITNIANCDTICSGENFIINLTSDIENTEFSWSTHADINLSGYADSGEGARINESPEITQETVGVITYRVTPQAQNCVGDSTEFIVTVAALPHVSLEMPQTEFCDYDTNHVQVTANVLPDGISENGNGIWNTTATYISKTTASFTPQSKGAGTFDISYSFESSFGCISEEKNQEVTIHEVPDISLEASTNHVCEQGANSSEITFNTTGVSENGTVQFYSETAEIDSLTGTLIPQENNIGIHTVSMIYENVHACADTAETQIEIHALPKVNFTDIYKELCYNAGAMDVNVTPEINTSETYTFLGLTSEIPTPVFQPSTENVGIHAFVYIYQDAYMCQDTAYDSVEVVMVHPPEILSDNPKTVVILNEGRLSDDTDLSVRAHTIETQVEWMPEEGDSVLWTGEYFSTGITEEDDLGEYKYAVRESKLLSSGLFCNSDSVIVSLILSKCPVPQPNVTIENPMCIYETVPEINAEISSNWLSGNRPDGTSPVFKLYESEDGGMPIDENTTGSFDFPVLQENLLPGKYTYWISEYNENVRPFACESQRTKVELDVYKVQAPVLKDAEPVCAGDENSIFTADDVMAEIDWYTHTSPGYPANDIPVVSSQTTFQPDFMTDGVDSVYAVQRKQVYDNKYCVSEPVGAATHIKSLPQAPETLFSEICYGEESQTVCIENTEEYGSISWYEDETLDMQIGNDICFTPNVKEVGTYRFFITNTVNLCESDAAELIYTIHQSPEKPTISDVSNICEGTENPVLTAEGEGQIDWLQQDEKSVILSNSSEFSPTVSESGNYIYKVRQTIDNCVSDFDSVIFRINEKPSKPIISEVHVCEGQEDNLPKLVSDKVNTEWFTASKESTGIIDKTYVPDYENITTGVYSIYARTVDEMCVSDFLEAFVICHKQPEVTLGADIKQCEYEEINEIHAHITQGDYNSENDTISWWINSELYKNNALSIQPSDNIKFSDNNNHAQTFTIKAIYKQLLPDNNTMCASEPDSLEYTLYPQPQVPVVNDNKPVCKGMFFNVIEVEGSDNMKWISYDAQPSVYYGNQYNFDTHQDLDTGVYRFDLIEYTSYSDLLQCSSKVTRIEKRIEALPTPHISGKTKLCEYDMQERYVTPYNSKNAYSWEISGNAVSYVKNDDFNNIRYVDWSSSGIDTLIVSESSNSGCTGYDTLIVQIASPPIPSFNWSFLSQNEVLFENTTIQIPVKEISNNGVIVEKDISYDLFWDFGTNRIFPDSLLVPVPFNEADNTIHIQDFLPGLSTVNLHAINEYGCENSYSEDIQIAIESGLHVPNAFAPTNPAHGVRYFQPKGFSIASMEIWVFDVWGNIVWYSNEVDEQGNFIGKWDGRYNGKLLKSDTYIWKIEAIFKDGQKWKGIETKTNKYSTYGSLFLIR